MKSDPTDPSIVDAAMGLLAGTTGRAVLAVRGDSMRPTLRPGDEVEVELTRGPFRRGDLLLFRQADYLVVHRLLGTAARPDGSRCLRTRGDGRLALDPPVFPEAVRGRAVSATRRGIWRTLAGPGPRGWAVAVAVHDLFWSAVGIVATRAAAVAGARPAARIHAAVAGADRALLLAADALAFKIVHRVATAPKDRPGRAAIEG